MNSLSINDTKQAKNLPSANEIVGRSAAWGEIKGGLDEGMLQRWKTALAQRTLLRVLGSLQAGSLKLWFRDDASDEARRMTFGPGGDDLNAEIVLHDRRAWAMCTFAGTNGAAEAYRLGYWTSPDLTQVIRLFVRNRAAMLDMEKGVARIANLLAEGWHKLRANTLVGSRKNIEAHYDLGNEFFALFLDETMTYSSAIFEGPDVTLEAAQYAKIDRMCRKLDLQPTDHLLEVGTGWGGFSIYAAREFGCRVTTLTISPAQAKLARERIEAEGLSERVEVVLQDYRELRGTQHEGRYDKLVTVEMIEAVGEEFYETYFYQLSRLLKPNGRMAMQAIVIADQIYEEASRSVDFIKKYIFPGSNIPSVGRLQTAVHKATDMRLVHLEDFTLHYAETLRRWRERFLVAREEILSQGFDENFVRTWDYYFCYCEGGFEERQIGLAQLIYDKAQCMLPGPIGELERGRDIAYSIPPSVEGDRSKSKKVRLKS